MRLNSLGNYSPKAALPHSKAANSGAYRNQRLVRFYGGFSGVFVKMHGKLHGLPKKMLCFAVIIAFCENPPGGNVGDSRLNNSSAAM